MRHRRGTGHRGPARTPGAGEPATEPPAAGEPAAISVATTTGAGGRTHRRPPGAGWQRLLSDRDLAVSAALVAGAVLALAAYLVAVPPPLRAVLTLPFLLIGPGLAVVRLIRIPSRLAVAALAVAVSLVLGEGTAMVAMYAGVWSPGGCLAALAALTSVVALVPHLRAVVTAGGGRHVLPSR